MTTTQSPQHVIFSQPAEIYHASPAIGRGMLWTFNESRRDFYLRYLEKTAPRKEPSEEQVLGSLTHLGCETPDWLSRIEIFAATKTIASAAYREFCKLNPGKLCVTPGMVESAKRMLEAIERNPTARHLVFGDLPREVPIYWTDPATGIECKCLPDVLKPDCIPDIKTARSVTPFAWSNAVNQFGYHWQHVHYQNGVRISSGADDDLPFVFVVVQNQWPWRVRVYDLPPRAVELAHQQVREALHSLKVCLECGDFADPDDETIVSVDLPYYAYKQDKWRIDLNGN